MNWRMIVSMRFTGRIPQVRSRKMKAKDIAKIILRAMEIYEASYVEHVDPAGVPCGGSHKKTKDQAIREACRGGNSSPPKKKRGLVC